jgi:hypothetical protein
MLHLTAAISLARKPRFEAEQHHHPVALGMAGMGNMIEEPLQLRFAKHLRLFALADDVLLSP